MKPNVQFIKTHWILFIFCIESDHDLSLNLIEYCQSLNYNTGKQGNIVGEIRPSGSEHFIFLQFGQRLHTMFCYTESDKQQPGVMDRYSGGMLNKVTRRRLFADNQLWILAVVNLCLVFASFFLSIMTKSLLPCTLIIPCHSFYF